MVTHFTLIHFYKQTTLRTKAFTQSSFYAQILLRREVCAQRSFTHRRFYAQRLLCKEFFRQKFLHTDILRKDTLRGRTPLHTDGFTQSIYTYNLLYRETFVQNRFYIFFLYKNFNTKKNTHIDTQKKLRTETNTEILFRVGNFTSRYFFTQQFLYTNTFIHRYFCIE